MTDDTTQTDTSDEPGGESPWKSIEHIPGPYNIGHGTGACCYLIDEAGRPRSGGYHEITTKTLDAGPDGSREYIGKLGASKTRISVVPDFYMPGDGDD